MTAKTLNAGTGGTSETRSGGSIWTNMDNVVSDNNVYATSSWASGGSPAGTDYLNVPIDKLGVVSITVADVTVYIRHFDDAAVTETCNVELSPDGGVTWCSDVGTAHTVDDPPATEALTSAICTHHTWNETTLNNMRARYWVFGQASGSGTYSVDHIYVIVNYTVVGTATFLNIQSINALSSVGGGGSCTVIESYDPFESGALDHVRANSRQTIVVSRPDGILGFKGEIDKIVIGYDTITYTAEEGLRKLNDSFCDINPILYKSDVRQVKDGVIRDDFADWTTNDYDGKMLITRDNNLFEKTDFPVSVGAYSVQIDTLFNETWTLKTPANQGGDANRLYFDDEQETPNVYGTQYFEAGGDVSCGHLYTFKTYDKEAIDVIKVVDIDVDNGSGKGFLTKTSGNTWLEEGFENGMAIRLSHTGTGNDGNYIISLVTDTVMLFTTVIAGTDQTSVVPNITQVIEWDTIELKAIARFTSLDDANVYLTADDYRSKIWIYQYSTTTWVEVYLYSENTNPITNVENEEVWNTASIEAVSGLSGKSPVITQELNLLSILGISSLEFKQQYMEVQNLGDKNDSNFVEYELQVRIRSPHVTELINHPKMEVHYMGLIFDQNQTRRNSQGQILSAGIISVNDTANIYMDGTTAWELDTFPQGDGVSVGDEYFVTDTIQDVLDNVFDADPIFSIDYTISETGMGETEDLTYTPKYDVLQKYADMLNLVFWYLGETDTVVLVDTLSSSGIGLTIADVVGWNEGSWRLIIDSSNLREKIVYIGDEGITSVKIDGVDYDVDYDGVLGDESVVYRDSELYTKRNVDQAAISKQNLHSTVRETIPLQIDLNTKVQSYDALTVGSTVAFTGSVLGEYDSGNRGELMVESISMDVNYEASDKMTVIFNLQKRVI